MQMHGSENGRISVHPVALPGNEAVSTDSDMEVKSWYRRHNSNRGGYFHKGSGRLPQGDEAHGVGTVQQYTVKQKVDGIRTLSVAAYVSSTEQSRAEHK